MVHMKAPSVLFNCTYPNIWICILRYEFTTFTRQNLTVVSSSVAVSEQWLLQPQPNLKVLLGELKVYGTGSPQCILTFLLWLQGL